MDKKYKLVLFDFFGVICCEISPYWLKARFPAEKAMQIKNSIVGSADNGEISEREMFERISKVTDVPADTILREWMECAIIDKGVLDIITELKKDVKRGKSIIREVYIGDIILNTIFAFLHETVSFNKKDKITDLISKIYNKLDTVVYPYQKDNDSDIDVKNYVELIYEEDK